MVREGFRARVGRVGAGAILRVAMRVGSAPPRGCWHAIRLGARITAYSCSFNYITMVRFRITKKGLIAWGRIVRKVRKGGVGGKVRDNINLIYLINKYNPHTMADIQVGLCLRSTREPFRSKTTSSLTARNCWLRRLHQE